MKRIMSWFTVLWVALVMSLTSAAARADAPTVIRIGFPGVGVGNRPIVGGSNVTTVHLRGLLEDEFKADGIQVKWSFLRGAGPATNELFANGLVDFAFGLGRPDSVRCVVKRESSGVISLPSPFSLTCSAVVSGASRGEPL